MLFAINRQSMDVIDHLYAVLVENLIFYRGSKKTRSFILSKIYTNSIFCPVQQYSVFNFAPILMRLFYRFVATRYNNKFC